MTSRQHPGALPDTELERRLDALAAADRSAAPVSLEDSVFQASRAAFAQPMAHAGALARLGPANFRLAAAVALLVLGGLIAATLTRSRPTPPDAAKSFASASDEALFQIATDAVSLAVRPSEALQSLQAELADFTVDPASDWVELDLTVVEDSM